MINVLNKNSKRRQIFRIIKDRIAQTGSAPTIREIMEAINAEYPREITYHLEKLEKEGYIARTNEGKRNIRVLINEDQNSVLRLPVVGVAPCGPSILTEENILDYVAVPTAFVKSGQNSFLIRASGDSMAPLIQDADLLIVSKGQAPRADDIVVAILNDNEVTVKKYVPHGSEYAILQPLNPKHNAIVVDGEKSLNIQGVVIGLMKYLQ